MQKLAIFGGTFNPVHWGHLLMAETALNQFALDRVIWVPTYRPAYKSSVELLNFRHRVEMVRQAIDAHPCFRLSTLEQNQPTPSHAIDTLMNLQSTYPGNDWYWIIGLDAFQSLPHWYRYSELVSQCSWLVSPRQENQESGCRFQPCDSSQGSSAKTQNICSSLRCQQVAETLAAKSLALRWHLLDMPLMGISSSLVRQRCRDRQSIRYLVPESVRAYILEQGVYQEQQATEPRKVDS